MSVSKDSKPVSSTFSRIRSLSRSLHHLRFQRSTVESGSRERRSTLKLTKKSFLRSWWHRVTRRCVLRLLTTGQSVADWAQIATLRCARSKLTGWTSQVIQSCLIISLALWSTFSTALSMALLTSAQVKNRWRRSWPVAWCSTLNWSTDSWTFMTQIGHCRTWLLSILCLSK